MFLSPSHLHEAVVGTLLGDMKKDEKIKASYPDPWIHER